MRKFLCFLLFLGVFSVLSIQTEAQSTSFTNINGTVINLFCGQTCTNLSFPIPHLKSTDDYLTTSIPYNPPPYTTSAPAMTHPCNGSATTAQDDKYLDTTFLPFDFCFYGDVYSKLLVTTNGYITFDISKALNGNNYTLTGNALPFQGSGTQTTTQPCPGSPGGVYYPRASIFAAYTDLWPRTDDANYKIESRVEGTAPWRRFVVSFYNIQMFNCSGPRVTSQIIINESTGLIEVNIGSKPLCGTSTSNNNRAIIGIQDWNWSKYAAPLNRNCDPFSTSNESWRFTPNGPTSRYIKSELLTLGGTFIALADTSTTTPGLLNLKFNNFCPAAAGQYLVRTQFTNCTIGLPLVITDTITVNMVTQLPVTYTATPTNCGASTGTITANVTGTVGTPPYQYSIDGGPLSANNFFTGLAAGNHTLFVIDFNGCQNTITAVVPTNNAIPGSATPTATSCPGVNNGTITVTPNGGTAPFTYTLSPLPPQGSNIFTGLAPGTYTITFTDAGGCSGSVSATVSQGTSITATSVFNNTGCAAVNNGSAAATPTSGTAPYTFSLNGGPFQPSGTFTGLAPGPYTITIKDANGCTGTQSGTIAAGASLASTLSSTPPTCAGFTNGSITITPTTGTAPYSYSLNGGPVQLSNVFPNLGANTYTINFSDANGCTGSNSVTLSPVSPLASSALTQDANCFGDNNGSVTINPSGGTAPYQFSIDAGVTYQPSASFNGLIAGNYTIRTKDANGCTVNTPFTINEPALLTGTAAATAATCNGNDGVITFSGNGGTLPYLFSIDNGVGYQSPNTFTVPPAAYNNLLIKDAHGCVANVTGVTVTLNDTMRLTFGPDPVTCEGTAVTLNPQTNAQTTGFSWTPSTGLNDPLIQNPSANPADSTTYTLTAKWGVCQRTASTRVNILTKPIAHAGRDTAICFQTFALLRGSATRTSGPVSFLWTPSAKVLPSNFAFAVGRPDSTQLFTLQVSDNYGCNFKTFDDVLVTMQPPVPAYAGNDTNAVYGIPHQLFSSGGVSYLWTPSNVLDNPIAQNPKATLTSDTRFTVLVTDVAGCVGTDDVLIKVYKGPTYYIPNAFSPNGDGLNDIFRPVPVGIVKTDYFRVFNRYGQLLFETSKWLDGWNGTYQGKKQTQGTYAWMIRGTDRNGKVVEMKGTVILIQ